MTVAISTKFKEGERVWFPFYDERVTGTVISQEESKAFMESLGELLVEASVVVCVRWDDNATIAWEHEKTLMKLID